MKKINSAGELINALAYMIESVDPAAYIRFINTFVQDGESINNTIDSLNRYWRYQLAILDIDTVDQRECLGYSRAPEAWLANFQTYILDTVKTYGLPTLGVRNG